MATSRDMMSELAGLLKVRGADGLLVTALPNVRYLSGFTGSDATLFITPRRRVLLTDSRYITQARMQAAGFRITRYTQKVPEISRLIRGSGVRKLLYEDRSMTVEVYHDYHDKLGKTALLPLAAELDKLRLEKREDELRDIIRAAKIAGAAFDKILPLLRPGRTEREIAAGLEFQMRRAGSGPVPFETIVASGPRGALPHGTASDKTIKRGELITFDFGAIYNGYNSDQTITVCLGRATQKQLQVYEVVREAQARAIETIGAGVEFRRVDAAAREHIRKKGFGKFFGHSLGHGVGLEIHEMPVMGPRSQGMLSAGMVVTVEPGIYIPGWGGVRIEDMVLVTKDGAEVLTESSGPLRVI